MIYISYAELARDVAAWSEDLPRDIDVFIGVPRSGIIPATMLALHRNVRVSTVEEFRDGRIFRGGHRDQHKEVKKVMVIDDSLLSGRSIMAAGDELKHITHLQVLYGAVYVKPGSESPAWFFHRKLELPRIFEWNWLHHFWMHAACVDIDGVLCRDPTREENDDGLRYRKFLHTVPPRYIPTVQIHTLVTSRLERYRMDTEKWLHRHGVLYKNLIMHPAGTAKERRKLDNHAKRKANTYRHRDYQLFVESSERQAIEINTRTGKPVLCTDTMTMYA